jgi:DNA-binding MarR family transcriptional regulator
MAGNRPTERTSGPAPVADGLVRLSRLIEGIHARVAQDHDLPPVQAKLLCILAFAPVTMSELARCLGVEKAAVTGLIDRAEQRGLVARAPVPRDRRAFNVVLTDAGRRAGEAFHAAVTAELDDLVTPLNARDHSGFARALSQIINASPSAGQWLTPPGVEAAS